MVRNINMTDLALIELLRTRRTDAPEDVLNHLRARGYLIVSSEKVRLTPKGERRAQKLQDMESTLRRLYSVNASQGRG